MVEVAVVAVVETAKMMVAIGNQNLNEIMIDMEILLQGVIAMERKTFRMIENQKEIKMIGSEVNLFFIHFHWQRFSL